MSIRSSLLCAGLYAGASLTALLLLGCSDDGSVTLNSPSATLASGNWQVRAAAAAGTVPFQSLSGAVTSTDGKVTALLHAQSAAGCLSPGTSFKLTGAADSKNLVTLTGPVAGGTLTLTGTVSSDGKSLTGSSYSVSGGSCATAEKIQATAQAFQPITGNYTGTFSDGDGQIVSIAAALNQSPGSNPDGNFTLSGTATLPNNPCFPTSVPISDTTVTGGNFTFTYATSDNSVTASGTFSQDASTLTVTSWTATGTCGTDHGTGSLVR